MKLVYRVVGDGISYTYTVDTEDRPPFLPKHTPLDHVAKVFEAYPRLDELELRFSDGATVTYWRESE